MVKRDWEIVEIDPEVREWLEWLEIRDRQKPPIGNLVYPEHRLNLANAIVKRLDEEGYVQHIEESLVKMRKTRWRDE